MSTFKFVVYVEADSEELALRVMDERLSYSEDYGFEYTIDKWRASE